MIEQSWKRLLPTLALAALAFVEPARAHDTYLLPAKFVAASPVAISLTSAAKFPALEYGPKKARIAKTSVDGPFHQRLRDPDLRRGRGVRAVVSRLPGV